LVLKSINSGLFFDNFSTFFNLSFEFKSAYHCSCTDKCYDIDYEYDITMGRYFTINKASVDTNRILLNFENIHNFTLIGTNLLRSADTLIISLSPLGSAAVALYSISFKTN
jgi:hypothetical protein